MGNNHMDTAVGVMTPSVWANYINKDFFQKQLAAKYFQDFSEDVSDGGDNIHIPNLGSLSANNKVFEAPVTLNRADATDEVLNIDTWKEVSFLIEDSRLAQVKRSYNAQKAYATKAASVIREDLDRSILKETKNFTNSVGSSTTNITEKDILEAVTILETKGIDTNNEVAFFMHPNTFFRQLEVTSKFGTAKDKTGKSPRTDRIERTIFGIPVYVTSLMPFNNDTAAVGSKGRVNCLTTKSAISFATAALTVPSQVEGMVGEKNIRMTTDYNSQYKGHLTTVDVMYGVKATAKDEGVKLISHESFKV